MDTRNRAFSLQWGLIGIIIGCWVLPIVLILGSLTYYASHSARRQFDDTMLSSVTNAAVGARRGMRAAVDASRGASYDGTVRREYLRYKQHGSRQVLYESLYSYLRQKYQYDDNFLTTVLFLTEEPSTIYYTFNPTLDSSYARIIDYQRDVHAEVLRISRTLDTKIAFLNLNGNLYMVRNIVDNSFVPYAVIVMQLNTGSLFGGFDGIVWETGSTVFLNGTPVSVGAQPPSESPLSIPGDVYLYPGGQVIVSGDEVYIYGRESIDAVEMLYAVRADTQGFLNGFLDFAGVFYMLLLLLVPLLALAIWFFYRNILTPTKRLSAAAHAIQEGELGYIVEGRAKNAEFAYLTQAFNAMSVRLKQQFERIYSEELALRDARIMALQSQINPHFLNNTLEIINWEARLGNNDKVSKMIVSLATMLDAAMNRKSLPLVPLSQEMMYVDSYLYIISERFGKRLEVRKDIDESLLGHDVPRLIMQPVIENAVEHGVGKKKSGVIIIRARREGDVMLLEVENNSLMSDEDIKIVGKLLSDDYDARSGGSLHLGIHNVNLRLKMIYGEGARLSIANEGSGTVSSIAIPISSWKIENRE